MLLAFCLKRQKDRDLKHQDANERRELEEARLIKEINEGDVVSMRGLSSSYEAVDILRRVISIHSHRIAELESRVEQLEKL